MKKIDKDHNVTQEYLDFVHNLSREDLETFYIGADLLVDKIQKGIKEYVKVLLQTNKTYVENGLVLEETDSLYSPKWLEDECEDLIRIVENEER